MEALGQCSAYFVDDRQLRASTVELCLELGGRALFRRDSFG